jgi:hypothetical protein
MVLEIYRGLRNDVTRGDRHSAKTAANRLQPVPVGLRAHPLSVEFMIELLPRDCFDAIGRRVFECLSFWTI